jgi:2-dehydropantoate 2-reductase
MGNIFEIESNIGSTTQNYLLCSVGTGALGCTYAWRLAQNAEVMTVCRSNYDVVKRDGFSINSSKWGEGIFRPSRGIYSFQFHIDY